MNITCETYGAIHPTQDNLFICKSFHNTSCSAYEKRDVSCSSSGNFLLQYCKPRSEKCGNKVLTMEDSSPYTTPFLSPMSSFGSFFSSYGDSQSDMNLQIRDFTSGVLDVDRSDQNQGLDNNSLRDIEDRSQDHADELDNNSLRDIDIEPSLGTVNYDGSTVDLLSKNRLSLRDINVRKSVPNDSMRSDVRLKGSSDCSNDAENANGTTSIAYLSNVETNPLIWVPPEPEIIYDEIYSVANDDDDDDICDDGSKWGQPSSLSSLAGDDYREERQRAMLEAMNGQFRILVSRLLAAEGISVSQQDGGENWLDIVVSLSWEAAELVKPDGSEGRAMDIGSYVKVKCVVSGSCNQSQVIKGLVFKKNAAHKHMPTIFRNPKLLLLQGIVGQPANSFSSFHSIEQEKDDRLKSVVEMIDACHPNVVLVEKTVSRDIQETLVSKGITLVFDMKLHRLERIARCTASPIVTFADITGRPKLKQCESFRIEKFTEEHNSFSEVGKRPSKTLMFLEGFPKPLGCTILLRGAHGDTLKKIKRVMQYAVFAAYHLILETSFFADQRVFSSDVDSVREKDDDFKSKLLSSVGIGGTDYLNIDILAPSNDLDIPIYNDSLEKNARDELSNSDVESEISSSFCNPDNNLGGTNVGNTCLADLVAPSQHRVLRTSVSAYSEEVEGDVLLSHISDSVSGFNEDFSVSRNIGFDSSSSEASSHKSSRHLITSQDKPDDEILDVEEVGPARDSVEANEQFTVDANKRKYIDNIESVLDPQSILVLISSQCITRQTTCEQSHLSRIRYYGNFDTSLGRYLTDILLNQKYTCSSCGEPPESHVYSFTHQNGNLTVFIRRSENKCLSGESEGKIWMWTRCLRCEHEKRIPRSSRRVVLSSSARSLSFGKFLDLSFSGHSAKSRLSKCGHSPHRDCLRFFGMGSKVAMFKYSPVEIYAASKPPPVLEFHNLKGQGWLKREMEDVLARGHAFFSEISNLLHKMNLITGYGVSAQNLNMDFSGLIKELSQVEEMLKHERFEFEISLLRVNDYEIPNLKWVEQELLLLLYVWDHRLHWIQQNDHLYREEDGISFKKYFDSYRSFIGDETLEPLHSSLSSSSGVHYCQDNQDDLGTKPHKDSSLANNESCDLDDVLTESLHPNGHHSDVPAVEEVTVSLVGQEIKPEVLRSTTRSNENDQESSIHFSNELQVEHCVQNTKETFGFMNHVEPETDDKAYVENDKYEENKINLLNGGVNLDASVLNENSNLAEDSCAAELTDLERLIWLPFPELKKELRKDLHGGSLHKFEFINTYSPKYLSPIIEPSRHQVGILHFTLGSCGNVLTASEDEISSIIACALAKSEDQYGLLDTVENEGESSGTLHKSSSLMSDGSMFSSFWSSAGSSEFEGPHSSKSVPSFSSDELSIMSYDSSLPSDQLLFSESLHSDIPLGAGKVAGRCRWSVVCIYAKQFYSLRRKCCPSELAYINSLSRCKKWDAQGGKSKAFFAKTNDERFIIKQIKKTELDSFIKFAPDYFKHVSLSLDSGSQTCLAKIFGIYQVRKYKSGKDAKIDLMVMENLLYGHMVSRTYDLKGAVFSRYIQDGTGSDKVLLDQNFVEDMRVSPIYVGGKAKHLLQRAIWNDTSFLTSINVMDYSLLVGVDSKKHEIVFGIIDYLRQYTWDKQLETWVKSSIVVPKNELPTVISPKEYKKRFRKFMAKYFLAVPDRWKCKHCSTGCKCCVDDKRNSAKVYSAELSDHPMVACA